MIRPTTAPLIAGLLIGTCALSGCGPRQRPSPEGSRAESTAALLRRDQPERLVLPHAPAGAGRLVIESVAPARADLAPAAPAAEPAEPPGTSEPPADPADESLKPPIARGLPLEVRGGRGGLVTLDVRVDESGEVSDVELVESTADSSAVAAASAAAFATRYFPARLGSRPTPVWARQVVQVLPGR